ncbi:hypothetical protein NDU88_000957 [Pleurodeles waltl]|uniref:Uncharacterized protein n=1 Tax=Pleurodeles waltl TaxID=8319 RepID=A0AAV7WGY8_PLEWA|nr:hypothetical protein NDU88_000957 [Pleurodeles waltl]
MVPNPHSEPGRHAGRGGSGRPPGSVQDSVRRYLFRITRGPPMSGEEKTKDGGPLSAGATPAWGWSLRLPGVLPRSVQRVAARVWATVQAPRDRVAPSAWRATGVPPTPTQAPGSSGRRRARPLCGRLAAQFKLRSPLFRRPADRLSLPAQPPQNLCTWRPRMGGRRQPGRRRSRLAGRGRAAPPVHGGPRFSAWCRLLPSRLWRLGSRAATPEGQRRSLSPSGRSSRGRHVGSWADRAVTGAQGLLLAYSSPPNPSTGSAGDRESAGTTRAAPPG